MGFNFKAFATAFMDDQAKAIQKRIQDAEDYEDQQRELAERNKSVVGKRRALVNLAKTEINMLRKLGAKDKHINAAIAAGPKALFEFSQSLQKEAQKRPSAGGSYTFSESELDAFIDMPDEFSAQAMDPAEHYANSIGLASPSLASYKAKDQGFLKSALGMGLKDSARARLDKDAYYEGYSMMDINEVARQEAYESMDPGTYFSFSPTKDYNPVSVGPAFREAYSDASELSPAIQSQLINSGLKGEELENAMAAKIQEQQMGVVNAYAQQHRDRFLEDTSINVRGLLGDDLYLSTLADYKASEELEKFVAARLLDLPGIDVGTRIKVPYDKGVVEIVLGEGDQVVSMKQDNRDISEDLYDDVIVGLQKAGKLNMSTITLAESGQTLEEAVPRPYAPDVFFPDPYNKYDEDEDFPESAPEGFDGSNRVHYVTEMNDRTAIVVGVPPRPSEGLFSELRGGGMSGEERDKILSGEMSVPKKLKPSQWDELFGETHNRDGSPKPSAAPDKPVDKPVESGILDLRNYETMEEKDEAFDALPIGGLYYDDDGSGPLPKGKERNG